MAYAESENMYNQYFEKLRLIISYVNSQTCCVDIV